MNIELLKPKIYLFLFLTLNLVVIFLSFKRANLIALKNFIVNLEKLSQTFSILAPLKYGPKAQTNDNRPKESGRSVTRQIDII